jgi:hypothetical protein
VVWHRTWFLIVMVRCLSIVLVALYSECRYRQLILEAAQIGNAC